VNITGRLNRPNILKDQPFEHFRRQRQHRQAGSRRNRRRHLARLAGKDLGRVQPVEITIVGIGAHDNQRLISWVIG
jgi:hypothetical protein